MTEARAAFAHAPCVYVQADPAGNPLRIGKASKGLDARYHGGNAGSIDAAMHGSGNVIFVASVDEQMCKGVEDELIWRGRQVLKYCKQGMIIPPFPRFTLVHEGEAPIFAEFIQ